MNTPNFKKPFSQFVKKQSKVLQAIIEDEVFLICEHPEIGEQKKGDLAGIHVHKFKFQNQQYLIAYRYQPESAQTVEILMIDFIKIGTHENFYTDLKNYLKTR